MPGKRKIVPTAGPEAGEDLGFSFEELQAQLHTLHAACYSMRQPGEFTANEYATANGITVSTANNILITLLAQGIVEKLLKRRFINGRQRTVYRIIKKVDQPVE